MKMKFTIHTRVRNWLSYSIALLIIIVMIWFSNRIVNELKLEEKQKVTNYVHALELLNSDQQLSSETQLFLFNLVEQNTTIPVILVDDKNNLVDAKNINKKIFSDKILYQKELSQMQNLNNPITIKLPFGEQNLYYKNSLLLNQLEYYPIILIIVIGLYIWFTLWYLKVIRKGEQSLLWAGMAKETAHQIGTPLSSMMGWLEILKLEDINPQALQHIEKDIDRLKNIADRFSKIGSYPKLEEKNIIEVAKNAFGYLQNRVSKQIQFEYSAPKKEILINLNELLLNWVIENLVKNAVDAMKSGGLISLKITDNAQKVFIDISDQGSGISKKNIKNIFKPGFTTKKRGWGLGLSLAKRIIEDYHKGKIFVLSSEVGKGTIFRIILKK